MEVFNAAQENVEAQLLLSNDELFARLEEGTKQGFIDIPTYDDFRNQPNCLGSENEIGMARRVIRGKYSPMSSPGRITLYSDNIDVSCLRICAEFMTIASRRLGRTEFAEIRRFIWFMVLHHEHYHYFSDHFRIAFPLNPTSAWSSPDIEEALAVAWSYIQVSEKVYGSPPTLLPSFVPKREREIQYIYDLVFSYTSPGYCDFVNYVDHKSKTSTSLFYKALVDIYTSDVLDKLNLISTIGVGGLIEFAAHSNNWDLKIE
jgi:hypothetical protein